MSDALIALGMTMPPDPHFVCKMEIGDDLPFDAFTNQSIRIEHIYKIYAYERHMENMMGKLGYRATKYIEQEFCPCPNHNRIDQRKRKKFNSLDFYHSSH